MPDPVSNFFMKTLVNSPLHPLLGGGIGVITFLGRKTGKRYSTPVNAVPDAGGFTVVSLKSRTWWRNLRSGGAASLRLAGKDYSVRGEVLESREEASAGLAGYLERHPSYAKYFSVGLDAAGKPIEAEVEQAAQERVVIYLHPMNGR